MEPEEIKPLLNYIINTNCIFFLGSGMNCSDENFEKGSNKYIPKGSDLAAMIRRELEKNSDQNKGYFKNSDNVKLDEISELYELKNSRESLITLLRNNILEKKIPDEAIKSYKLLLKLPLSIVLTTNYDNTFKQIAKGEGVDKIVDIYDDAAIIDFNEFSDNIFLIKIHGDLEKAKERDNIIITKKDFIDYKNKFPKIETYLKYWFANRPIIFLGFALNDRDVEEILYWTSDLKTSTARYAVLNNFDENDARIRLLKERKIKFLKGSINEFLKILADEYESKINKEETLKFSLGFEKCGIHLSEKTRLIFEMKNISDKPLFILSYQISIYKNNKIIREDHPHWYGKYLEKEEIKKWGEVDPASYYIHRNERGEYRFKITLLYVDKYETRKQIASHASLKIS